MCDNLAGYTMLKCFRAQNCSILGLLYVKMDTFIWFVMLCCMKFTFSCLYLSVHLLVCVCVCVSVCLSIRLSVYVSLCLSVCLCECLFVCLYVYMHVVYIVINVCKLLHVRRPTSSPRAVWNPCKINKALY